MNPALKRLALAWIPILLLVGLVINCFVDSKALDVALLFCFLVTLAAAQTLD